MRVKTSVLSSSALLKKKWLCSFSLRDKSNQSPVSIDAYVPNPRARPRWIQSQVRVPFLATLARARRPRSRFHSKHRRRLNETRCRQRKSLRRRRHDDAETREAWLRSDVSAIICLRALAPRRARAHLVEARVELCR